MLLFLSKRQIILTIILLGLILIFTGFYFFVSLPPAKPANKQSAINQTAANINNQNNANVSQSTTISYYQLRFQLTTTSGGTRVTMLETDNLLSQKIIEKKGNYNKQGASLDNFYISQEVLGGDLGLTVDYAINPKAATKNFPLKLEIKDSGQTKLQIFNINKSGSNILLKEFIQSEKGAFNFNLDLSPLKNLPVLQKEQQKLDQKVYAYYYTWYNHDSWKNDPTFNDDQPFPKPYNSGDPEAIRQQIGYAKSAGIEGFVSTYQGFNDQIFKTLLNAAKEENFEAMVYLEIVTYDQKTWEPTVFDANIIYNSIKGIIENYGKYPAYSKINNRPIIPIYNSYQISNFDWQNIFSRLKNEGYEAVYLAEYDDSRDINETLNIFDGIHFYGYPGISTGSDYVKENISPKVQSVGKMTRYYSLLNNGSDKIWAPSVTPGFDDRKIPGRFGAIHNIYVDRENGNYYRTMFEMAIKSDPDWIMIDTWNEWPEHTYIEPSVKYGEQYLNLTKEYVDEWEN
jgi:hypothetical protein